VVKRLNEKMPVESENHKAEKGDHPDAFRNHHCVFNNVLTYHSQCLLSSRYFCMYTNVMQGLKPVMRRCSTPLFGAASPDRPVRPIAAVRALWDE
jgi:hypothetical protein